MVIGCPLGLHAGRVTAESTDRVVIQGYHVRPL